MKRSGTFILALLTVLMLSCNHRRRVVIASQSNNYTTRLEYTGTMAFNNDRTKLVGISGDGYIDYKRNNDELHVSSDGAGHISYELNGARVTKLDAIGQSMLDEAIGIVIKSSN